MVTRPPCDEWVPGNDAGSYTAPVDKVLIHTTEGTSISGSVAAYRANNSWPHLTVDCRHGNQPWRVGHLDLDVPARALRNEAGGVETNRDGVIQIEVVGSASRPAEIDWVWLGGHVVGPICAATGVPVVSTVTWAAYPGSYGRAAPQRLPAAAWSAYRGVLGHQHVPENSHGDPGAIPIAVVLAAALPPDPVPQEDDVYFYVRVSDDKGQVALGAPGYWHHLNRDEHAVVKAWLGRDPKPVTLAKYHLLRAACLHGERCANDATS